MSDSASMDDEELEILLEKFFFKKNTELMSYSDSFESRMRDRFITYVKEIREAGTSEENNQILRNSKIIVKKKSRRDMDLVNVQAFLDRIELRSTDAEARTAVIKILKEEKNFKQVVENAEDGLITVKLPKMDLEKRFELADFIESKFKNYQKNVMMVKNQSMQQIRAGLQNEFIFGPDAAKASKEIEKIIDHYIKTAKLIFFVKHKDILRNQFKLTEEDDIVLARKMSTVAHILD